QFNATAGQGHDAAFGKGSKAYNRYQGDAMHGPNPCVAPFESGPYYAIKMVVGDLGTYAGIVTDGNARAIDAEGRVIPCLYSAGQGASLSRQLIAHRADRAGSNHRPL